MSRLTARITQLTVLSALSLLAACTGGVSPTGVPDTIAASKYSIGGSVSGLSGSGLMLQSNTGEKLATASDGSFTFNATLTSGTAYYVVVADQPGTPNQSCSITNGEGMIAAANVTDIVVTCKYKTTNMDSVGGVVVGTQGTGLVLQNNGGDDLTVGGNGPFNFKTQLPANSPYSVSVLSPPTDPYQDCIVTNSPGTTGGSDVGNVVVSCTVNSNPKHTISVTAHTLTGTITLLDNGRDPITIAAPGIYPFSIQIPTGSSYKVTASAVKGSQSESCTFQNGSGVVGDSDIDVVANCAVAATEDPITATVSGLSGSGLVLQNNNGDNLSVTQNGPNTFATAISAGTAYSVTVLTQPGNPNQTCQVTNGSGTAGKTTSAPTVSCTTNLYPVSGTVSGLIGTGLVLQDNGGDTLLVSANGPFTFATQLTSGIAYNVTVAAQPLNPAETCTVANSGGVAATAGPAPVVTCVPNPVLVTIAANGLAGSGLTLQDNGGDNLAIAGNGVWPFPTMLPYDSAYNITILAQPTNPNQTCAVVNGTGSAGVTFPVPTLTCVTNHYTIGGTVTGLKGSGLVLQDNGGDNLAIVANGPFAFATQLTSATPYKVTAFTQPTNPSQTCSVTNGTGTPGNTGPAPTVNCVTNLVGISAAVTGLNGAGLVLQDNGGDNLAVNANGQVTFPNKIPSGDTYAVTILTQPTNQNCTVANGTGTAGVTTATPTVSCVTNLVTISVTVAGLSGGGLVLQDNGGDTLAPQANGTFHFATQIPSGNAYSVTVLTQPANPAQTCTVTNGGGTAGPGTGPALVTCVTLYTISGAVTGLPDPSGGNNLILQNNNGDTATVQQQGPYNFTFKIAVASGSKYAITVQQSPGIDISNGQGAQYTSACVVTNGTGTITANVTNVVVNCVQPIGFAYVTNSADNTVSSYLVSSDGSLTPSAEPVATGTAPSSAAAYIGGQFATPQGSFLYVTNQGSNDLSVYSLDPNTGVPTAVSVDTSTLKLQSPATIASGPSSSTFFITGSSNVQDTLNTITTGTTGTAIVNASGSPYVAKGGTPAESAPSEVVASTLSGETCCVTGLYYVTANSLFSELHIYPVDSSSLLLTPPPQVLKAGAQPTSAVGQSFFYPPGVPNAGQNYAVIYVANSGDGSIYSYLLNSGGASQLQLHPPAGPAFATIGSGSTLQLATIPSSGANFLLATDGTALWAFQINSNGVDTPTLTNVFRSPLQFPATEGPGPGPMTTFNGFIYVVDVTGTAVYVLSVSQNGLEPLLDDGQLVSTATTGKAPSSIVVQLRPSYQD